ncbi:MAG: dTDP-glucose 4,6-dehydratase [Candidatus Omnitrophica bacterium]|nr:dTDP-glucose 4,6-dehydratase [Candidatus Omnitrophota bacterium]
MRILVTGGAGFIGSNFIRYILKEYPAYKIINLDKLTYCGNLENLRDVQDNPNYKFIKGDICDSSVADDAVKGCDAIINFAAQTHVDRSIADASEFIQTNINGTYILLEAAKKYQIRRTIQISTDEVYGSREHGSFKEEDALYPNSPYAASKAAADHLARSYFVTYKLPVLIIRSSNNFGPYQYPEKVIPLFVTNALENKKLPLYGDGLNVRDWLYVLDNCRAIDLILHKGEIGQIYNVAAGNEKTNLKLTKLILKILQKPEDLIEYVNDRPGHDRRYSMDLGKIKGLGWQPQYQLQEALKETINWYQNNKQWWKE